MIDDYPDSGNPKLSDESSLLVGLFIFFVLVILPIIVCIWR